MATPDYGSTAEGHTVAGEGVTATGDVAGAASEETSTAGEVRGIINTTQESIDTVDSRMASRAPSRYMWLS